MKKIINNLFFVILILFFYFERVDALTLNIDQPIVLIGDIACGIFIVLGIILIIRNRSNGKLYTDEKDKTTAKINDIDSKMKKNSDEDTIKFDPDSIFKTLPTFSPNRFMNDTFDELKNKLMKDENIKDIKLRDKRISNFTHENDKYMIDVNYSIEETVLNDGKETKIVKGYLVSSSSSKDNKKVIHSCPNCGGKIKDTSILRCKYCGSILPKIENDDKIQKWSIDKYTEQKG